MCIRPVVLACALVLASSFAAAQVDAVDEQPDRQLGEIGGEPEAPEEGGEGLAEPVASTPGPAPDAPVGISNAEVVELVEGGFSDTMIVAVIRANETQFDISPRALVTLKNAGVSEPVMEVMLAAEAAKRQAAEGVAAAAAAAPQDPAPEDTLPVITPEALAQMSPEQLAAISEMLERVVEPPRSMAPAVPQPAPEQWPGSEHSPRAWIVEGEHRALLVPTIAQVAFTDARGGGALNTLQGLAGRALAFANPALGIAGGVGGLFRSGDPAGTMVWALLGPSASRALSVGAVFEVEFAGIPGVNPDDFQPAIVELVPTSDNYRLVGAARTRASSVGGIPTGSIIEELAEAAVTRLARGRYRVSLSTPIPRGEYALVVRPIAERERRRNAEGSLGELMGGHAGEILYTTWDFAIR